MSDSNGLADVAGASSGIGLSTVRLLAPHGFHVLPGVCPVEAAESLAFEQAELVVPTPGLRSMVPSRSSRSPTGAVSWTAFR